MITHIIIMAGSCFPNCHPAGHIPSGIQQSGNAALGLVFIGLIALFLLRKKGG